MFAIMVNKAQGKWCLNDDYKLSGQLMMMADGYTMLQMSTGAHTLYNSVDLS